MTHHSHTGDTPNGDPTTDTTDHELRALDRLVGTWQVSGEASGTISYAWMDGGFFLVQTGELDVFGHHNQFTEIIGRDKPFGGDPSNDIKSRVYTSAGDTLDYVYELTGDTLTIWGGHRDSDGLYTGKFSVDGNTLTGAWSWPGGGYATTTRRQHDTHPEKAQP